MTLIFTIIIYIYILICPVSLAEMEKILYSQDEIVPNISLSYMH